MARLALLVILLMHTTACTQVISESGRKLADPAITYGKLKQNPDSYIGKVVILGGKIAVVRNAKVGGTLEVVQMELDRSYYPEDAMFSGGRFLATSAEFLDRVIYEPGRMITILGEVKGKQTRMLDEVEYTYPVVAIRETHVWRSSGMDTLYSNPSPYFYQSPYYYGHDTGPAPFRPPGPPLFK
ncbi:Slp family lipoprotein [Geomobilimonas luticola]|uniref:Slp family lipoprotein n=1 Tax=Geomobilimonas luticola TaxID=1114878 RepID=A0ABS5SC64_9BACT|nr:Slp family lipoprotein [Geomobilimonas luticola]MBT0652974.1 Slp family lipoprotein [Geomobilimonas luticola]